MKHITVTKAIAIKTCSKCKLSQPVDNFYFSKSYHNKDNRHSWCKTCIAQHKQARYVLTRSARKSVVNNQRAMQLKLAGRISADEIEALFVKQEAKCANPFCGVAITYDDMHIDHINPLCKGGENNLSNIQLLCVPCNRRKARMSYEEFLRREDFADKPIIFTYQAAKVLGMSDRNLRFLLEKGAIYGAIKLGREWAIPNPPIIIKE